MDLPGMVADSTQTQSFRAKPAKSQCRGHPLAAINPSTKQSSAGEMPDIFTRQEIQFRSVIPVKTVKTCQIRGHDCPNPGTNCQIRH